MNFEIIIHGGFELVRDMWIFIAMVCASPTYTGLLTSVFLLATVLAAVAGSWGFILGGRPNSITFWARAGLIAIFLHAIFLSGNSSVTIRDDVTGQFHIQSGVPTAIAATAGLVNKVAIGLESMIQTYLTTPTPPTSVGYDRGTVMLREAFVGAMSSVLATQIDPGMQFSADMYAHDCIAIEAAARSSYKGQLERTSDQITTWSVAAHPALFTWSGLDASGAPLPPGTGNQNVSCQEAWSRMNNYLASPAWASTVDKFCEVMEYDASDTLSRTACRQIFRNSIQQWVLGGGSMTPEQITQNLFFARTWNNFLAGLGNKEAALAQSYATAGARSGAMSLMLNQFLPTVKTIVFAILCGLIPLIVILMMTPAGIDAVKFMFGLFIWWAIWCCVDMICYTMWLNRANGLFELISAGGQMGIKGLAQCWPMADRALTQLGTMRGFGMLIASAVTFGVLRLGGSSMAHLSAGLVRSLAAGIDAGAPRVGPQAGEAQTKQMVSSEAVQKMMSRTVMARNLGGSWSGFTRQTSWQEMAKESKNFHQMNALAQRHGSTTGSGYHSLGQTLGDTAATKTEAEIARAGGLGGPDAARFQGAIDGMRQGSGAVGAWQEYEALRKTGLLTPGTTFRDYQAGKATLAGALAGTNAYAFKKEAERIGMSVPMAAEMVSRLEKGTAIGGAVNTSNYLGGGNISSAVDVRGYTEGQKKLNEAVKMMANNAVASYLQTGNIPPSTVSTLNQLTSTPEGQRFLEKHLNNMEISGATHIQAKRLTEMADQAGMKDIEVKPGDKVSASFGYDPKTGRLGLADLKTSHAAEEVRGSKVDSGTVVSKAMTTEQFSNWLGQHRESLRPGIYKQYKKELEKGTFDNGVSVKYAVNDKGQIVVSELKALDKSSSGMRIDDTNTIRALTYDPEVGDYVLKEGYLAENNGEFYLVSGNVRYGLDKGVVTMEQSPDGTQALMFQDVKVDPNSGKIVAGKETSILVREGAITKAGITHKGTIYEDTNTGNVLVVNAKAGGFYEYTETGNHWTVYRGWDARGSYMLSRVKDTLSLIGGEEFGVDATQFAGDVAKGAAEIGEAYRVLRTIKSIKTGSNKDQIPSSGSTHTQHSSSPSNILGPDGKTPASEYQSFGRNPKMSIKYQD